MVKSWTRTEDSRAFLGGFVAGSRLPALSRMFSVGPNKDGSGSWTNNVYTVGQSLMQPSSFFALEPRAQRQERASEQGNYRLTTFTANDGAMIGTHVVTVNMYASESEASLPSVTGMNSKAISKAIEDAARQSSRHQQMAAKSLPQIPKKYAARTTSGLSKEVAAGDNTINIDL